MTTDVIVNGSPRIRLEKLTRYMPPLLRKTRPDRRCSRRLLVPPQSCRSGKSIRGSGTKATRTNKSFIGVLRSAWSDGVVAHWVELIALEVEAAISSLTDVGPPQTRFTRSCVCPNEGHGTQA